MIESVWEFILAMIGMDVKITKTIATIKAQWQQIKTADTETALREELPLYLQAERISKKCGGNKVLCTHEERVHNFLASRSATLHEKFFDLLERDEQELVELSWDSVWTYILKADRAADRERPKHAQIPTAELKYCKLESWSWQPYH